MEHNPLEPDNPYRRDDPADDEPPEDRRSGPVWENRGLAGYATAFMRTVGSVLFRPQETFSTMRVTGGILPAFWFWLIPSAIAASLTHWFNEFMYTFLNVQPSMPSSEIGPITVVLIGAICFVPVCFGVAGLYHLFVMIMGANKHGYAATFRVFTYVHGSLALIQWIPCIGPLIQIGWSFFLLVIGVREIHETTTARALIAVVLAWLVLLCLFIALIVFVVFVIGFGVFQVGGSGRMI